MACCITFDTSLRIKNKTFHPPLKQRNEITFTSLQHQVLPIDEQIAFFCLDHSILIVSQYLYNDSCELQFLYNNSKRMQMHTSQQLHMTCTLMAYNSNSERHLVNSHQGNHSDGQTNTLIVHFPSMKLLITCFLHFLRIHLIGYTAYGLPASVSFVHSSNYLYHTHILVYIAIPYFACHT